MRKKLFKIILRSVSGIIILVVIVTGLLFWRWHHNMSSMTLEERLEQTMAEIGKNEVCGAFFQIYRASDGFTWHGTWGGSLSDSPYPITSITKMYTATVIMCLENEGALKLDDPIALYVEPEILTGLHVINGRDYGQEITIRHLLQHTSGLPDTTEGFPGMAGMDQIRNWQDITYSLDDILRQTKALKPHYAPGTSERAKYTDTNYQLLGLVIEKTSGFDLADAYEYYIFSPLNLQNTYLQTSPVSWKVASVCHDGRYLHIPGVVFSERSAGGIISTAADSMVFLRAYFACELFTEAQLKEMQDWHDLEYTVQYGMGLIRAIPPWPFNRPEYEVLGHTGFLGSISYYCPARDIYITGTISDLDSTRALLAVYRLLVCFDFESAT